MLDHILENGRLTVQDYERLCPEVNQRILQRDLNRSSPQNGAKY
jgi:hypothetical protein